MKHHLLAIGISRHQSPFVQNLTYAGKEAAEFFDLVTNNVDNIGYKALLVDSEATLAQIRSALGSVLQKEVGSEDVFIFFYSGHGTVAEIPDGSSLAHLYCPT